MGSKCPLPLSDKVKTFIGEYPDLIYDGAKIFCAVCRKALMCKNKRDCRRHINAVEHTNNKKAAGMSSQSKFMFDVLVMFIACNLPFYLLDRQPFQHFWNTYNPKWKLPSRSLLLTYVPRVHESKTKSNLN